MPDWWANKLCSILVKMSDCLASKVEGGEKRREGKSSGKWWKRVNDLHIHAHPWRRCCMSSWINHAHKSTTWVTSVQYISNQYMHALTQPLTFFKSSSCKGWLGCWAGGHDGLVIHFCSLGFPQKVHRWNLKSNYLKGKIIFPTLILGLYVIFRRCTMADLPHKPIPISTKQVEICLLRAITFQVKVYKHPKTNIACQWWWLRECFPFGKYLFSGAMLAWGYIFL